MIIHFDTLGNARPHQGAGMVRAPAEAIAMRLLVWLRFGISFRTRREW